jgi:hypothetical protein
MMNYFTEFDLLDVDAAANPPRGRSGPSENLADRGPREASDKHFYPAGI